MDPLALFLPGATSSPYINSTQPGTKPKSKRKEFRRRRSSFDGVPTKADLASFTPDLGGGSSSRLGALANASFRLFESKEASFVQDVGTSSPAFLYRSPVVVKPEASWAKSNTSLRERLTGRADGLLARSASSMSRRSDPVRSVSRCSSYMSTRTEPSVKGGKTVTFSTPTTTMTPSPATDVARSESLTLPASPKLDAHSAHMTKDSQPVEAASTLEDLLMQTLGLTSGCNVGPPYAMVSHEVYRKSDAGALDASAHREAPGVRHATEGQSKTAPLALPSSERPSPPPKLALPPDHPPPDPPASRSPSPQPSIRSLTLPEKRVLPPFPLPPTPLPPRPPRSTLRVATNVPPTPLSSRRMSTQSTVSRGSATSRGSCETAGPMTPEPEDVSLPTVFEVQQRWPWGKGTGKATGEGTQVVECDNV